ncbi:unnamed protein product [Macrosiphum euphorbiae]|uniref:Uncharacterized protein n=1 Tax=Macrosiphum euphorbiae TaxID=13131 RepID=A0AAV0VIM3_9HEMI|nr:unnamed protein product [Macrosiphum euphorbiae]CAI6372084.1 unnamed protein product [Macrosiphum euphorbiae]CAI6372720.1 unnamed protein product [Macrosiphum euphorbiae]
MSYRTIASTDSENEHFSESIDMRPSFSKTKPGLKRTAEKTSVKKPMKKKQNKMNVSYRDNVTERLRSEEFDVELINSLTFRQGDGGVVTIKSPFEEKAKELWVISHYKVANIENVPVKDRWKFSEATVRLYTSDESKDQTLHTGLNETMQTIFDKLLTDPKRQTIKSKTTV